jgi:hypothetical protein
MSEYTEIATTCDNCYPDYLPSFTFFRLESVAGVFRGARESAYAEGWKERDYGDICPKCVAKEKAEDAEEGEMVHGQQALMATLGLEDEG